MRYEAVAATTKKVEESRGGTFQFSNKALTQLAETALNKLVTMDFNVTRPIGKIVSARNDEGKLVVTFETPNPIVLSSEDRVVPGFVADHDEWQEDPRSRIIHEATSFSYGLTGTPVEKDLPEIREDKE